MKVLVAALVLIPSLAWAQSTPTQCIKLDAKSIQCQAYINNDLSLKPGSYKIEAQGVDGATNVSDPALAGTVVVPAPDTTKPTISGIKLQSLGDNQWFVIWTCTDDVECAGGKVIVTPVP